MGKSAQFLVHQMVLSQSDRRCTLFKLNVCIQRFHSASTTKFFSLRIRYWGFSWNKNTRTAPLLFIFIFTNPTKVPLQKTLPLLSFAQGLRERPDACCQICVLFKICFFPVTGRPNLHLKCILDGGVNGTFIVRRKQLTPGSLNVVHNSPIQNELRWKTRGF